MYFDNKILIGKSGAESIYIYPTMANRHGLIAGATGTGKTITVKVLAESFSDAGVPVFLADMKGDLAAMSQPGSINEGLQKRIDKMQLAEQNFAFKGFPSELWDVYGEKGLPLRTTVSDMGPILLGKILGLNDTQTDVLTIVFSIADAENLLLIDSKDLRAMLQHVGEHAQEYSMRYGNLAKQSLAAILRAVVALETEGGDVFFGEPALELRDWLTTDCNGKGTIQILDCGKLLQNPNMYATFMLWLLSNLFQSLPEVGDMPKPKMVFFFDEAHLLFSTASKELITKIEQIVKLIRSKGVGIYFITQNPKDIPDGVLGQLGNKIQHALHAYTPTEQKAAKAAAMAFRENPEFNTYDTLVQLGTGEALISVLDENGVPTIVKQAKILPPQSQMGVLEDGLRLQQLRGSLLYSRYMETVDRDSAYENLQRQDMQNVQEQEELSSQTATNPQQTIAGSTSRVQKTNTQSRVTANAGGSGVTKSGSRQTTLQKSMNSAAGTIGREIGNELGKQIAGDFGKKIGGNIGAIVGRGILGNLFRN